MPEQVINPDVVCQQLAQARLALYEGKESYEGVLKRYNDEVVNLVRLVELMKLRILELEKAAGTAAHLPEQ